MKNWLSYMKWQAPLSLALVSFCLVLIVCKIFAVNGELVPALASAIVVFWTSSYWMKKSYVQRDQPNAFTSNFSALQTYEIIINMLKKFVWNKCSWELKYCDQEALSIMAVSEWRNWAFWMPARVGLGGHIPYRVILDARVKSISLSSSQVELSWTVTGGPGRGECDELQDRITNTMKQTLLGEPLL